MSMTKPTTAVERNPKNQREAVKKELIDSGELERAELIKKLSKGKEKRIKLLSRLYDYKAVVLSPVEPTTIVNVNCARLSKYILEEDKNNYRVTYDGRLYKYENNGGYYKNVEDAVIRERVNFLLSDYYTKTRANEVLSFVYSYADTLINREELHAPPELVCLKNGIYNLKTGEFTEHNPDICFINSLPITYDPNAKCPKILKFIEDLIPLNYKPTILESFGDTLYREYVYKKAILCAGPPNTGKTMFANLIECFLGQENCSHVSLYALCGNRFAPSDLYGKMANTVGQLGNETVNEIGMFLMLTGRDPLRAEKKGKNAFNFINYALQIYGCNDIPQPKKTLAKHTADAYYERWVPVPFSNVFSKKNMDRHIIDKITTDEELSGLFNLAIKGWERLEKNNGYTTIMELDEVRDFMEKGTNPEREFIDSWIIPSSGREWKKHTYKCYVTFCLDRNYPYLSDVWFSRKFSPLGPASMKEGHVGNKKYWKGITCKYQLSDGKRQQVLK